jgi:hypothetical protein
MTTKQYLDKVLEEHSLNNDSSEMEDIRKEREKVEKILCEYFKDSKVNIKYGGSKSKNTMIKESYDLDIISFFNSDETKAGSTLKELFENTEKALQPHYFVVRKTSALRLERRDNNNHYYYHIDVLPGRYVDEKKEDAYLHQNNGDKDYHKTNVEKQVSYIKDSGLQRLIKLIKYWKIRNGLQIKTFVLELLIIKILKDCDESDLEKCLLTFWNDIIDNWETFTVEDPANPTGNDLSSMLDYAIRISLKFAAENTLNYINSDNWEAVFGPVKSDENKAAKISVIESIAATTPIISKPWAM